jgi:hypothetical protein
LALPNDTQVEPELYQRKVTRRGRQLCSLAPASWERPYGLAWYLQVTTELRQWNTPQANVWLKTLQPWEADIAQSLKQWLPKLAYPIRLGTQNQSALAFGLMLYWAREANDAEIEQLIIERSLAFHLKNASCPLAYEPSGEGVLSPCLMAADLMSRIIPIPV